MTTTIIAIAGLFTTALVGLGGLFIQGRIAARNALADRLHQQCLSAYIDAMHYIQHVEDSLDEVLEHPGELVLSTQLVLPHTRT
jgi:hypothetical protein